MEFRMSKSNRNVSLILALASLAGISGCTGVNDPPPFNPRSAGDLARAASSEVQPRDLPMIPTTAPAPEDSVKPDYATTGPSLGVEPQQRMTLQEVIQRAVANNLDVKVAGYTPAIDETRVIEAEARFDPTYFAQMTLERRDRDVFISNGASLSDEYGWASTAQTGLRQNLQSGGQVELRAQTTNNQFYTSTGFDGTRDMVGNWDNQLVLQLTQPLLRDFGNDINRARITINRNNQRVSILEFRKQLEETLANIEETYWRLVQAERDLKVQEQLLSRTTDTAIRLINRRNVDVTDVQINQAIASVEQRRRLLISAKRQVKDFSDQLKRLMQDPAVPVSSATMLLPSQDPLAEPLRFDLQEQMQTALENRFELGQQSLRIDNADVARQVAKNNLLPELNLTMQGNLQGLENDFGMAMGELVDTDRFSWQIGVSFEIPIGNRAARAIYARAMLQRQQAVDQYRNLIDQIQLEVSTSARGVETRWEEVVASRKARYAAEKSLAGIESREAAGEPLTPEFVNLKLQEQERLAQAFRDENEAAAQYNISIEQLERSKGTLLKYNNVILQEEDMPFTKKYAAK
jgi:outer membrane protein TolC